MRCPDYWWTGPVSRPILLAGLSRLSDRDAPRLPTLLPRLCARAVHHQHRQAGVLDDALRNTAQDALREPATATSHNEQVHVLDRKSVV